MKKLIILFFLASTIHPQENRFLDAIVRNNIPLANYMIKHRVDVTMTNEDGLTPLHLVSDPHLALSLIKNGADINAMNRSGSTPLHWAVSRDAEVIAELLLEFGADPDTPDINGNTPLHLAVNASEEMILLLIRSGANVNAVNFAGSTPIIEALLQNNESHSKYLLLAGAEDIKNKAGISPSILESLESDNNIKIGLVSGQIDPLIKEIFIENYAQAITLIKNDAAIDTVDVNGNTALHWAFNKKHRYISKLLLQKQANYNCYNYEDQTPLDVLLSSEDTNFILYIQNLLKDETNFYDPAEKKKKTKKVLTTDK